MCWPSTALRHQESGSADRFIVSIKIRAGKCLRLSWLADEPEWEGGGDELLDHVAIAGGEGVGAVAFDVDGADHVAGG